MNEIALQKELLLCRSELLRQKLRVQVHPYRGPAGWVDMGLAAARLANGWREAKSERERDRERAREKSEDEQEERESRSWVGKVLRALKVVDVVLGVVGGK